MTGYVIAQIEVTNLEKYKEYDAKVWKPMLENYDDTKINLFWNVAGDL